MAKWKYKLNIKQYLSDREDREAVELAARCCITELKKIHKPFCEDLDYEDIVYEFEEIAANTNTTCEDFNYALERLYDWADDRRVWLGL